MREESATARETIFRYIEYRIPASLIYRPAQRALPKDILCTSHRSIRAQYLFITKPLPRALYTTRHSRY